MRLLFHVLLCALDVYLEDGRSHWHVHTSLDEEIIRDICSCAIGTRIRAELARLAHEQGTYEIFIALGDGVVYIQSYFMYRCEFASE